MTIGLSPMVFLFLYVIQVKYAIIEL